VVLRGHGRDDRCEAVLYEKGNPVALITRVRNAQGWTIHQATGISNAGYIVGVGRKDSVEHAYLLTPVRGRVARGR
jgi:hypothetical protein